MPFTREGKTVCFRTEKLELAFTHVGVEGGCLAEKDNAGCFIPVPEPVRKVYPRLPLAAENAAVIPCTAVLGAYVVEFER